MAEYMSRETQLMPDTVLIIGYPLMKHFDVEVTAAQDTEAYLEALQQLDPRYKGERALVRYELEQDQTEWPDETVELIDRTADALNMKYGETPLKGEFDAVIVLGGARQSNLDRANYAARAVVNGDAKVGEIIVAGSTRTLNDAEKDNVANYAPNAQTEGELCRAAAEQVARQTGINIRGYELLNPKAGTPAVVEQVLGNMHHDGKINHDTKIAAVTTQIYQASTSLDVARVARGYGIEWHNVATAGNPSDPKTVAKRTPATYLSEILRTLRAAAHDIEFAEKLRLSPEEVYPTNILGQSRDSFYLNIPAKRTTDK